MYLGTQGQPTTDDELRVLSQLGVNHVSSDPPGDWKTWDRAAFTAHKERLASFGIEMDIDEDVVAANPSHGNTTTPGAEGDGHYAPGTWDEHVYVQTRFSRQANMRAPGKKF